MSAWVNCGLCKLRPWAWSVGPYLHPTSLPAQNPPLVLVTTLSQVPPTDRCPPASPSSAGKYTNHLAVCTMQYYGLSQYRALACVGVQALRADSAAAGGRRHGADDGARLEMCLYVRTELLSTLRHVAEAAAAIRRRRGLVKSYVRRTSSVPLVSTSH